MSKVIVRPAALVKQGLLTIYSTSLKVSDLLIPNFYSVETLDPEVSKHLIPKAVAIRAIKDF